jgi:hypothetical protein
MEVSQRFDLDGKQRANVSGFVQNNTSKAVHND